MDQQDIQETLLKYGDIIELKRPQSKYKKATDEQRASQFMPFDALTGYGDAIDEADRETSLNPDYDENSLYYEELNQKICKLKTIVDKRPLVTFTIFIPDKNKEGGAYEDIQGHVRRIDEEGRQFYFSDHESISFEAVIDIKVE